VLQGATASVRKESRLDLHQPFRLVETESPRVVHSVSPEQVMLKEFFQRVSHL
jgi:hypothetical protein